ncbi:MAG: pyridoxamine 5'-phosphate oxidase family protein [Planctomycetes bacterium]|nr:pyridoxamine 5'-phosphate oxidase family protein [Planctomycetota bacterium]
MEEIELSEWTRFLARWRVAGMATVGPDGEPHACNVVFVCDDQGHLFFLSGAHSAHAAHVDATGRAAFSVYSHGSVVQGLQLWGRCRHVEPGSPAHAAGGRLYLECLRDEPGAEVRRHLLETERLYCARVEWARLIDMSRGSTWRGEWRR